MLDFENQDNAVYIAVYPFEGLVANKDQGLKILEEASECREKYDDLANLSMMNEEEPGSVSDDIIQSYVNEFALEACDCIQATVNLLAAVFGSTENVQEILNNGMFMITQKNVQRGWYGEPEEEEKEETVTEEEE